MADTHYNAANVEQVRERKRTDKERAEQYRDDLRKLLDMPEFRRYLWRHMTESCGLFKSAANGNGSIQSQNIGMQDVGRLLWGEVEAVEPLALPRMMSEFHEGQK